MLGRTPAIRTSRILAQLGRNQVSRSPLRRYATEGGPKLDGPMDNAFNRERQAVKGHAAATSGLWRRLSIYVVIPCLVIASANAYNLWNEHWEHWSHMPPLEERTQYPYQNIRTKNYFWGDGDQTLFWNPKVNYHKHSEE